MIVVTHAPFAFARQCHQAIRTRSRRNARRASVHNKKAGVDLLALTRASSYHRVLLNSRSWRRCSASTSLQNRSFRGLFGLAIHFSSLTLYFASVIQLLSRKLAPQIFFHFAIALLKPIFFWHRLLIGRRIVNFRRPRPAGRARHCLAIRIVINIRF
jgi:hypothetical protein